jgi:methyl-galactoside transport system substrate-binding protein
MKKLLLLLSVVILGVVVSCTGSKKTRVDLFFYKFDDTYLTGVRTKIKALLDTEENLDVQIHDGGGDQQVQTTQIENAIIAGSKLLVVNTVETSAGGSIADKAKAKKLPIFFFNREVSDAAINSYDKAAFIGTDPDEAGYLQGSLATDILLAAGAWDKYDLNHDGKISYVMLRADLDNPEANGRTKYSVEEANRILVAAGKPALVRLGEDLMAGWSLDTAKSLFDTVLTSHTFSGNSPVEFVFANNDDMALGAVASLQGKGYNTESDASKYVPVVGVDATETAQIAVQKKTMSGTIKQDGDAMATAIVAFIKNAVAGNTGADYIKGTSYSYQASVRKVRIPYAKYTG